MGDLVSALPLFALGTLGLWWWRKFNAQLEGVQLVNLAVQETTRGRLEEADALLARIAPHAYVGALPRAVPILRALIALHRGKPEQAVPSATAATDTRLGIFLRPWKRGQRAQGFSLRALAHVALNDRS
jgi:hypothetical protein